ncbi:hypothetical protein HDV02_001955 [Globomyces sp. JEL0801]|nr:hypothetical protein HDV02_001955 [Globomyces sp. JEL0801]
MVIVAVELAYPCIQIRWRYGRSPCKMGELPLAPVDITSSQQLEPFLNRYGLTRMEMAVLIAGTHGLKNAKSIHGVFGYGDGVAWIRDSMGLEWKLQSSAGVIWYNSWNGFDNLIRLPSDMMFFPRVLRTRPIDYPFLDIELGLKELGKNPPSFYADFERVFAKMLEIGVANDSMVELIEEKRVGICLNGIVQVKEDNTTLTENEQQVVSTTSPIPNSSQTNFSLIFYLCLFYLI